MNVTQQTPIRYNIDALDTALSGVIISDTCAVDTTDATAITSFHIEGVIPNSNAAFFLFNINSQWHKLDGNGNSELVSNSAPDFETLQKFGNTPAQLTSLKDIPALTGIRFGIAIGLLANDPANSRPKIKISLDCITDNQILQTVKYSPTYTFANSQIAAVNSTINTDGSGQVNVTAQYTDAGGEKSDWVPIEQVAGKQITALQFKADYFVSEAGGSSFADLDNVNVIYALNDSLISGTASSEIITQTENWYMNIKECRLTVKHAPLDLAGLKAYVSLRPVPVIVHGEQLGIGSGTRKTFQLANVNGIRYDSVRIYYDNVRIYSDYEVNTQVGRVTCEAPEGVIVSCDYEYGWALEEWHEMELNSRISLMDYDTSEYKIYLPENNYAVCAVKISLEMSSGHIANEHIGKGTGIMQTYRLSRICNDGEIIIFADGNVLDPSSYILHDDTQYISISAELGVNLTASYQWVSESPAIYQVAAVFSE